MKGKCPSCRRTVLRIRVDDDDFALVEPQAVLVMIASGSGYTATYANPVHSCEKPIKR